ncbi:ribose 5-phosphate isomerase B [Kordiimonas sp. SCSIO 12610]|uniref:ribose 5-phosphate isomerase B n=1 Tax=Kordiimonas sp. SCSIO 12610 TaxID=2829597 RepID=UPI00210A9152|nr:ribose 5-phosphate isomerase B [Kordiimonas sp. SCSIO 12610]UTW54125.1 ribose 5-phosphate isomerase B [Kordiimonas sp. SCSIO 12610]
MKIAISSDHAGYDLKEEIREILLKLDHEVVDLGPESADSVDYPDYGKAAGVAIADGVASRAIIVCGSGIGISIAANRNPAVRAALCTSGLMARLSRQHNDANVLALGARLSGIETVKDCIHEFLNTPFEGGRHQRRVDKLS